MGESPAQTRWNRLPRFRPTEFPDLQRLHRPITHDFDICHAYVMSNYKRIWVPGGTYFFTHNLCNRKNSDLLVRHIDLLRECVTKEKRRRQFQVIAWVVLPEHMHWLWRLPRNDDDFATRWRRIKTDFSLAIPDTEPLTETRLRRGQRGIWQRRYWEHQIRDERDRLAHIAYIHSNPIKHGYVQNTSDWPHSSFHHYASHRRVDPA